MSNATIANNLLFCLCYEVLKTNKTHPKLLYNRKENTYLIFCPACGFKTLPDFNKQAVIASWFTSNRFGDSHIKNCWITSYNKQTGSAVNLNETMVPLNNKKS
ncbi:hypothetical protein RHO12_12790 (plasmid) [Orbus sturtevantii]|uniref:hypothetical protein n=1 Tax=Orbus sturtevantii TaxID=3074109 RepID=UPI00370D4A32